MGWRNSDILELKLKDESNRLIYKSKVVANDVKKLSLVFASLQSLGVKVIEAVGKMINQEEKDSGWFG